MVNKETDKRRNKEAIEFHSLAALLIKDLWMWGMTPPPAMVPLIRVSSSSSPLIASCKCLGVILFTFRSLLAFPANSRTSAVRYSRIDAKYTAAVAPTRPLACTLCFNCLWIRPTGNYTQQNKIKLIPSMHQTISTKPNRVDLLVWHLSSLFITDLQLKLDCGHYTEKIFSNPHTFRVFCNFEERKKKNSTFLLDPCYNSSQFRNSSQAWNFLVLLRLSEPKKKKTVFSSHENWQTQTK